MMSSKVLKETIRFITILVLGAIIAACNGSSGSSGSSGPQLCNQVGNDSPALYLRLMSSSSNWGSYDIAYNNCGGLPYSSNESNSTSSWNVYSQQNGQGNLYGTISVSYNTASGVTKLLSYESVVDAAYYLESVAVTLESTLTPTLTAENVVCPNCVPYSYPTSPASYSSGAKYRGVNLAGAEYDYAFQLPSLKDGGAYANQGMNTIRLPFLWEYLQSSSTNTQVKVDDPSVAINFNNPNAKNYAALVDQYVSKGMTVIIDMHNYMRYGSGGNSASTNIIGGSGKASAQQYAAAWVQIGTRFQNNPKVMFDLMNEPNNMSTELVLANYNVVLSALRKAGINNTVLLEGNGYSGAWSWASGGGYGTPNATVFNRDAINDSENNYIINVHQYFDYNYSGTSSDCVASNGSVNISGLTNYLTENDLKAMVTELGGANTQTCADDINTFLSKTISDSKYIGWTGWVGGYYGKSQVNYFGGLADGSQTTTMTNGFGENLTPQYTN